MESAEVGSAKTGGDGWVSWVSIVPGSATGSEAVVVGVLGNSGTEDEAVQKLPYAGGGAGVLLAELPENGSSPPTGARFFFLGYRSGRARELFPVTFGSTYGF